VPLKPPGAPQERILMAKTCFYEVLGVSRTATDGEMKTAFRKAAMQYHPDRNPGNAEAEVKFKELNEAYQTLTDGQKRSAYDRFGHAAFEHGGGGGGGGPDGFGSSMADIFDDLFGDMMGRRMPGRDCRSCRRGPDIAGRCVRSRRTPAEHGRGPGRRTSSRPSAWRRDVRRCRCTARRTRWSAA
jgi:curved DNA-binding protein CbpA